MSETPNLEAIELRSLLGTRLKERRRELGRKLAEVAADADVSTGYLSTIETGGSVPSLPVLARLAHALDLSLAEILRTSASTRVARGRLAGEPGTRRLAVEGSRLQIVRTSAASGDSGAAPVTLGTGDVFVYVCEGTLEVVVDGDTFAVAAGDALHCDLPRNIDWRAVGEGLTLAVWTAPSPAARLGARG